VRPDYEYQDVKSLVAAAKAAPGKLVFASPGFGATQHMAAELFKQNGNIDMLHVPYRTSPEAISALLGKNVDVLFDTVSAVLGQVQGGQLKVLAVTGKDRFPAVPNVPTVMESGVIPDYDVTTWYGFFAPKGTPRPIIEKLNKTLNEVLVEDVIKERLTKAGVVVKSSTPDEWRQFMIAELKKWSAVREKAGIEQR
jgi:tripartite-type tricarboxylate transporter receptor subunit TctC